MKRDVMDYYWCEFPHTERMMDAACTSMPWARTTSSTGMDPRTAAPHIFDRQSKSLLNRTLLSHSSLAAFCVRGSVCSGSEL